MQPVGAGGGYLWIKRSLPDPSGFIAGWMDWFAHAVACSLYAVAFGTFAVDLLDMAGVDLAIGRDEVLGDFHPLLEPELVIRESTGPAPTK